MSVSYFTRNLHILCIICWSNRNPVIYAAKKMCEELKPTCSNSSLCRSLHERLCKNARSSRVRSKRRRRRPKFRRKRLKAKPARNLKTKLREKRRRRHQRMRQARRKEKEGQNGIKQRLEGAKGNQW